MAEPCEHIGFDAKVEVGRLTQVEGGPVTGYVANVFIWCAMCEERFVFIGVPSGMTPRHPAVSFDGTELRAPVRPISAPEGWGEDGPGFTVRIEGPDAE